MTGLAQDRPIVFFDLETTGTNRALDRIVEIALVRMDVDQSQTKYRTLVNPGIPIPEEASRIHHITDEMVANEPTFSAICEDVAKHFDGADLSGFNILGFDIELLTAEFARVGKEFSCEGRRIIDVMRIFHAREPRDLSAALQFYCGKTLDGAHAAMNDVLATMHVLEGQLARYEDLPGDPAKLHALCNRPRREDAIDREGKLLRRNDETVMNFGKYQGNTLPQVYEKDARYLKWVISDKTSIAAEVKKHITEFLAKAEPASSSGAGKPAAAGKKPGANKAVAPSAPVTDEDDNIPF